MKKSFFTNRMPFHGRSQNVYRVLQSQSQGKFFCKHNNNHAVLEFSD